MSRKSARMGQLADLMAVELNQPPVGQQENLDKGIPKSIKNKKQKQQSHPPWAPSN